MADKTEKVYVVSTIGGETLTIKAYDIFINVGENRIYFLDAKDEIIEEWMVFYSGVAAIRIRAPGTWVAV